MRTKALLAVAAAALAAGGAGALLFTPTLATAQDEPPDELAPGEEPAPADERPSRLLDALADLVEEGVINQEQADAVHERLQQIGPRFGDHRRGGALHHGRGGLDTAAEAMGIDPADLREALMGGQSMAEVAEANGVDPQVVIDALVDEAQTKIDEKLEEGRIDQERADEISAGIAERIEAMVDGTFERPGGGGPGFRGGFGPRPGFGPPAAAAEPQDA